MIQVILGLFTCREEDPSARKILERGIALRWVYTRRNFDPCGAQVEKEIKMTGDNYNREQKNLGLCEKPFQAIVT